MRACSTRGRGCPQARGHYVTGRTAPDYRVAVPVAVAVALPVETLVPVALCVVVAVPVDVPVAVSNEHVMRKEQ